MIYLDTAALVKMVRNEPESEALGDWLDEHEGTALVSSTLADVELPRALRRTEPALVPAVPAILHRIARYEIDDLVRTTAAACLDPSLRSPDAIHLATAQAVVGPRLSYFVSYDRRLLAAAADLGLPVCARAASD